MSYHPNGQTQPHHLCPRCNTEEETLEHLFVCQKKILEPPWARGLIPINARTTIQTHEKLKKNAS